METFELLSDLCTLNFLILYARITRSDIEMMINNSVIQINVVREAVVVWR